MDREREGETPPAPDGQASMGRLHCLTIIGQIEGHTNAPENAKTTKYEHLLPLLASLEESDEVDGVLILLNTVGGDVEIGRASCRERV